LHGTVHGTFLIQVRIVLDNEQYWGADVLGMCKSALIVA
jgi:hypothetical protein